VTRRQVAGKLLVNIQRVKGSIPERMLLGEPEDEGESSDLKSDDDDDDDVTQLGGSNTSADVTSDLSGASVSSSSSGVGSSLSTDPAHDPSNKTASAEKVQDLSNSSLSTTPGAVSSFPSSKTRLSKPPRVVPQITCK